MFNFGDFVNVTNVKGGKEKEAKPLNDIILYAQEKIRINAEGMNKIGCGKDKHIIIQQNRNDKSLWLACVDASTKLGRLVNVKDKGIGEFTHQTLHPLLGGQYSEWVITDEKVDDQAGNTYYKLSQVVNGADVIKEMESKVKEQPKDQSQDTADQNDESAQSGQEATEVTAESQA
jgi:hypothetical protein